MKSSGIMSLETVNRLIEHIFQDLEPSEHLSIEFQVSKPTMAGRSFFEHFIAKVN